MDITTIKEFICLTKYLNFSEAAFVLHVSQPTLSRHIAALEYELNATLFDRNKSTGMLTLTAAGEAFLPDAKQMVISYDSALKKISGVNSGYKKHLSVAYRRLYHCDDWDNIFDGFSKANPDIQIDFKADSDFSALFVKLINNVADIVISANINAYDGKNFCRTRFTSCCFGGVINVDHPLSEKETITFEDLHETDVLLPSPEYNLSFSSYLNEQFHKHDVTPIVYQHMKNIEDAEMLVKRDLGINIIPEYYYVANSKHYCFRPIAETDDEAIIFCYMKKDQTNPAAREFFKYVQSYFPEY